MAQRVIVTEDDPETAARDYIAHADDRILGCRGQMHSWPKLPRRSGPVRRGIRFTRSRMTGVTQVHFICRDCGAERITVTGPEGDIDMPSRYQYVYPDRWKAPKGVRISRKAAFEESIQRMKESDQVQIEMID